MDNTRLVKSEPESFERPGPAYDVYVGDKQVGRVYRMRHVYRTLYAGKRYGYDRAHLCWWGERSARNDDLGSLRCYTSRKVVVQLLVESSNAS